MKYTKVDAGALYMYLQKVNVIVGFILVNEISPQRVCD